MGLEEQRAIKAAKEGWLPKCQKELNDLCGTEVKYEIDWATFDGDAKGINWLENNGPVQVNNAFRLVCQDELGKDAVKAKIKKVVVKNVKEASEKKVAVEKDALELHCAFAKSPGGRFDAHDIKRAVEKAL